jgi:hypothetical protein
VEIFIACEGALSAGARSARRQDAYENGQDARAPPQQSIAQTTVSLSLNDRIKREAQTQFSFTKATATDEWEVEIS